MLTITLFKLLICFIVALLTSITIRFILKDKREQWFKRSANRSVINQRGFIGQWLALGYPVTKQGYLVLSGQLFLIAIEILIILILPL